MEARVMTEILRPLSQEQRQAAHRAALWGTLTHPHWILPLFSNGYPK